jgi:uncharacterized protein YbjT (DUF2867 family)
MRVFITGGTGFVGRSIVKRALAEGHQVICLVRNRERAKEIEALGVQCPVGDILDQASLIPAMRGSDAVMHLVGVITEIGKATFEAIHYQGTVNVVSASKEAGIKRYVHMSALGTRQNAVSRYHQTKWQAEEYVRTSGLDFTIFRPSIIFGRHDQFINTFIRLIRLSPIVPIVGAGTTRVQPIWVEDVAACFTQSLQKEQTIGKVYELGGPEPISLEGLIDILIQRMKKSRLKIHVPVSMMKINAAIMELILPRPPLTREMLTMLQEDNTCDAALIEQQFDLRPLSLEDGLREYSL